MAGEIMHGRIVRQTRNGNWIARFDKGLEMQLPGQDSDLALGWKVEAEGVKPGRYVSFPVRYRISGAVDFKGTPKVHGVYGIIVGRNINVSGREVFGEYLNASIPEYDVNLLKSDGPRHRNADVGTMVEIQSIDHGVVQRWCYEWDVAKTQYPQQLLTPEQKQMVEKLSKEHSISGARTGTVALINYMGMLIRSDENVRHCDGDYPEVYEIWKSHQEPLPVGARVVYGGVESRVFSGYRAFPL